MAIYSYHCVNCDSEMESREFVEEKLEMCENCKAMRIFRRRIGKTHFRLKGSDWCGRTWKEDKD